MSDVHIETERLILRQWKDEDLPDFARMNSDPIVMEYFPRRLREEDTSNLVARFQKHFKKHGYGLYAVENKETNAFMGFVGLNNVDDKMPFAPAVEMAWRIDYEYWGQGYATEAAQAVLDHTFSELGLEEIVAFAVHDNTRAIHLMEKLGMKRDKKGDFKYPALRKDHPLGGFVLYRLSKKDHEKSQQAA